jgi:outer membrane protein assembly factor BamD (BamD/ComL family)
MKKLLIVIVVALFAGIFFLPEITAFAARQSFKKENIDKAWAPDLAYRAARINMKLWRYGAATAIFEKVRETWPDEPFIPRLNYQLALCYENRGLNKEAKAGYEQFLKAYPKHPWADQARKRLANIEANEL